VGEFEDEKTDGLHTGRVDGGIPIGKISMISAPSMLGKSFVAMGLVKNAQRAGIQLLRGSKSKSIIQQNRNHYNH